MHNSGQEVDKAWTKFGHEDPRFIQPLSNVQSVVEAWIFGG